MNKMLEPKKIAFMLGLAALIAATALPMQGIAQTYPSKPVKVVVGYAAGGAVDIVARTVGQSMPPAWVRLS